MNLRSKIIYVSIESDPIDSLIAEVTLTYKVKSTLSLCQFFIINLRDFATYKKPKKEGKKDENIYIIDSKDNLTSIDYQSLLVHTFTNKIEVNPIIIFDNIGHPNIGEKLEEKLKNSGCLFD